MSWSLLLEKTPKPNPKGKGSKTPAPDKAPANDKSNPDTATNDGGILHSLGGFLWDHPIAILVLLIAALIGINYGWSQLRKKQALRGIAVRPLGAITKDTIKFAFKEDKRPVHKKTPWLTGTRLYGLLLVITIIGFVVGIPGVPPIIAPLVLVIALWARASKIFKARRAVVSQMFAVANGECRYPKGSELAPWSYINVTAWQNLVQPGMTVVSIPAAYQSEDMKTREKFERQFNGTVSEENAWTYKWESAKNRIVCEPAAFLPNMASYPGPGEKWDEIPVGVRGDGSQAIIPLSVTPHALVCGPTGSGKSVLQRSVLFHILAHSDTWRLVAIDMKKVEMAWLKKYPQVLKVATDLEEAVEVLRSLRAEMMRRYEEMEQYGVNHAKDLPDPPKAIFCMIDESTVLLAPEGIKSDEGKERDALHAEAGMIIGELGRLSRASMIHVMACFQRPDATFLKGETKANFDVRIAAGRMDTTPSLMVLDSEAANRLPKIKGRGMIRVGGELDTFQGYFAEQAWFDEWAAAQEAAAAGGGPEDVAAANPAETEEAAEGKRIKGLRRKRSTPSPDEAQSPAGDPADTTAPAPKKTGGLKGLAAKAAAKAEARAARLDAEASDSREPDDAPVAHENHSTLTVVDLEPSSEQDGIEEGEDFDFDFDFDEDGEPDTDYDADYGIVEDDVADDDEQDDEQDDEPEVIPAPAPIPERPVVPQPVQKAPAVYRPGDPLPDFLTPTKPKTAPPAPTAPPVPAQPAQPAVPPRPAAGLPVRPPAGLPVRPPAPPQP
jgi:hypothetical protein